MDAISTTTHYCPNCGNALDQAMVAQACPFCSYSFAPPPAPQEKWWGVWSGLLAWVLSVVLLLGFQVLAIIVYLFIKIGKTGQVPKTFELDWLVVVLSIVSTFPAHLLTLLVCWLIVTGRGKRPFWQSLGWSWHPQFKWVHAVALAFLMMGVALLLEKILPHKETDLEKLLKMGTSVRVLVAALAVLTAPLVEEVVYRGVLYSGVERIWGKVPGVAVATFLFALVHVPQYWGSYAAITAILTLSLVLTLVRSVTGKLLPCVATHLVYNGVQAVALLFDADKIVDKTPAPASLTHVCQWLGLS